MRAAAPVRDRARSHPDARPDRIDVTFDDGHAVADAGLLLAATLLQRLGAEAAADRLVGVGFRPGRKALTVICALLAGADCIDDVDVLRAEATERVLGHQVMAPSTVGTWLRSFTFGHVRQLDRLSETLLTRAWAAGAGPGGGPLTIDVDSTICEVHGYAKQGAAYGYTRALGYHPLLATRADTGEVLHARMRAGNANTGRGAQRFVRETVGRVRRAGATGPIVLRADSGFWSAAVMRACRDHEARFSITARLTKPVAAAIAAIDEDAWTPLADYSAGGEAQVAETTLSSKAGEVRLVVRRTRVTGDERANRHAQRDAARVALPRVRHRPRRRQARPRRRAPRPRRGRAGHPRPQGGVRVAPLPLGRVQRQRRVGGAGHDRAQPAALGRAAWAARGRAGGRQDDPPPAAVAAGAAHPQRPPDHAAPAGRLAVEAELPGRLGPAASPAARLALLTDGHNRIPHGHSPPERLAPARASTRRGTPFRGPQAP